MTTSFDVAQAPTARLKPGATISRLPGRRLRTRKPGNTADTGRPLVEWHSMAPAERRDAWRGLVDWVAWLHDRYELSKETRLPECWPQHPGIIEELWALKAWRGTIYTTQTGDRSGDTGPGQGVEQAARYWHNELRQVLTAVSQVYAPRCLSGHKPAALLSAVNPDLLAQWRAADPLAGVDPALIRLHRTVSDAAGVAVVSEAVMTDALMRGTAAALGETVTDYIHYRGAWWTHTDDGWLQVTEPGFAAELDAAADRLRRADAAVHNTRLARQLADGRPQSKEIS